MAKYITIPGTWAVDGNDKATEWWQPNGEFAEFMRVHGHEPITIGGLSFVWSTSLEGVNILRYLGKASKHADWKTAAQNFRTFIYSIPYKDRNIIAHSHGGQVALYAAAMGTPIRNLITVSTPVRRDMRKIIEKARPHIGYWAHVHSDRSDIFQILGGLFDGAIGCFRKMDKADINIKLPSVGHSKILKNKEYFKWWVDSALIHYLEINR